MNRLHSGRVPPCLSSAITPVPVFSEASFPSFTEQRSSFAERELPVSSVTSIGTSMAAYDTKSTHMLASNFTNESPNRQLCSGSYVTEPSDPDTPLLATHSSLMANSTPLVMDFSEVSEQICLNQDQLLGLFDYPASVDFYKSKNMTIFGQQVQDTITVDPNTHLTPQNELFSSGSSMQLQKSVGYPEAVLKVSGYMFWSCHGLTTTYSITPPLVLFCIILPVKQYDMIFISELNLKIKVVVSIFQCCMWLRLFLVCRQLMQEVQHLKVIYASILRVRGVYQILSTVINLAPTTSLLQTLLQSQGCAGHLSFMSVSLMLLTSSVGAKVGYCFFIYDLFYIYLLGHWSASLIFSVTLLVV